MTVWVIRGGKLVQYERLGKCLGCGECCEHFAYNVQYTIGPKKSEGKECADLTKREGWAIEDWDDEDHWHWWGPLKITPRPPEKICKCFDIVAKQCGKFDKKGWPEICRKFPFRPEDLKGLKACGFSFKEIQ